MTHDTCFTAARQVIAGGVNSPVRAFKATATTPLFIKRAHGKHLFCEDGSRYLDFCLSWGAIILGHNHPVMRRTLKRAVSRGTSYGLPTVHETKLASTIIRHIPSIEKIRFVSSGTEAVMSAVRLARGYTKRAKILKFDGCYHGHADSLLVKAGDP